MRNSNQGKKEVEEGRGVEGGREGGREGEKEKEKEKEKEREWTAL